jgi:hypothetical protein
MSTHSHEKPSPLAHAPKYLTSKAAAQVYGVHRDFFRKTAQLRRHRIIVTSRTHLYPVRALDAFFLGGRASQ